ncbi:MAG: hypothetical protein ABSC95_22315 [Acetobacteraceae bacterium]|jgi:hypothetical protein
MTIDQADFKSRRPALRLTVAEAGALLTPAPKVRIDDRAAAAPRGDGHPVLVLPALARGDRHTAQVREFLTRIGYDAHGWNLGANIAPTSRLLDGAGTIGV